MAKFLYGANVKSVQQFIFQTGKLTDIIGASEIVEEICTDLFEKHVPNFDENKRIIGAAGIIKYIFDDESKCRELVRKFPKIVYSEAPGIDFSQAVVKMEGKYPSGEEMHELENRLKTQRNKAIPPLETGLRITERSRRTGLPGIEYSKKEGIDKVITDKTKEVIDKVTKLKRTAFTERKKKIAEKLNIDNLHFIFPTEMDKIASEDNYLAIIHADGNNMGKAIRDLNEKIQPEQNSTELNKHFSQAIDDATVAAAKTAVKNTFKDLIDKAEVGKDGKKRIEIPFRPVILGGDDFTVICNAKYALDLTRIFLVEFEKESKKAFATRELNNLQPLTSCAGIAFIKTNYPFHYGAKLAEDLCGFSKNEAKKKNSRNVPSCLTFHRVLSSFVGEYKDDIINRELTASAAGLSFCAGPYYISKENQTPVCDNENQWIDCLVKKIACLENKNTPVSKIRDWISTCHISKHLAIEDLKRIIQILNQKRMDEIIKKLNLGNLLADMENPENKDLLIRTSIYDALTIDSLNS